MSPAAPDELVGHEVVCRAERIAHGGHVVARHEGLVLFVRHALPGELVRVRVTESGGRFVRADAIEVIEASPHRVEPPCPLARPDGCGGCDFQHVALEEQRRLKAEVVAEQLQRLAGLDREVVVEPVPGDDPDIERGLHWRTRMQYVGLPGGRRGLRKHRSHEVVPVADCPIEHPDARETLVGSPLPATAHEQVRDREFAMAADGFWQVHPGAPEALVGAVLAQLHPRPGEGVLDLYSGVGLFTAFLARAVGSAGEVVAVEGERVACGYAADNLADLPWARVVQGRVDRVLERWADAAAELVVLDPPRAGAKRPVVDAVARLHPRAVSYVACDPAAMARDLDYFARAGYELADLRAFDLFPMTHHVECVALLRPEG